MNATPESQGIASQAISAFLDAAESIQELHGLVIIRHGQRIAAGAWAPYKLATPRHVFSVSKSFTATAIGLLVDAGQLSLDALVAELLPDALPAEVSPHLAALRVRDLLTMATGHAEDPIAVLLDGRSSTPDWAAQILAQPLAFAPGTQFVYNSAATYLLSVIVQRVSGVTLLEFLQPRLFAPLGITVDRWEESPDGIPIGGWGLFVSVEGIARLAQLYLQQGEWAGQQIVSPAWVAQATAAQIANGDEPNSDWSTGYGFQFWRSRHGYRADGAFGQYGVVLPEQDAVIAITSSVRDMQAVLNVVWEHLLPAFQSAPLPADPAAAQALAERLATLELPRPRGVADVPERARVADQRYRLAENALGFTALRLEWDGSDCVLKFDSEQGAQRLRCSATGWSAPTAEFQMYGASQVAASYAWTAPNALTVQAWSVEAPFGFTLDCTFGGARISLDWEWHISFGPLQLPTIEGHAVAD